jgi:trimeric autotransporter adhesin
MVGSRSSVVSLRLAFFAILACSACTEPIERTQVTLLVDADDAMREQIRYVEIEVRSGPADAAVWDVMLMETLTPPRGAKSWPLSLALGSPEGRGEIGYSVTATAKGADDGDLTVVRAQSEYVKGKSLVLRLRFDEACAERTKLCPTTFTCQQGECIDPRVPASQLPTATSKLAEAERKPSENAAGSDAPQADAGRANAMPQAGSDAMPAAPGCSGSNCGGCPARDGQGVCLPCPAGFLGSDAKSCSPGLISLEVSSGTLEPAFDPKTTEYTVRVPFLTQELTLRYALPPATELLIDGRAASSKTEWTASSLELGKSEVVFTLTASEATTRMYTIQIERMLKQDSLISSPFPSAGDAFGTSVAISGDWLIAGAPYEDGSAPMPDGAPDEATKDSGAAYLFERTESGWVNRAYLKAEMPRASARFGWNVAIDGKRFAVGAPYEANAGSVYVYEWRDGAPQLMSVLHAESENATFGRTLALQGDRLAIGAPGDSLGGALNAGALYVYEFTGGAWQRSARLIAETPGPADWLGSGMAMDGDIIVGGATGVTVSGQPLAGAAYVFERTKEGWHQVQKLTASQPETGVFFGESLTVMGTTIAVGGFFAGFSGGSVAVFQRGADGKWTEEQTLRPNNTRGGDCFGERLWLIGDLLFVGAPHESSAMPGVGADGSGTLDQSGSVYAFRHESGTWTQSLQIKLSEPMEKQEFGIGLGISKEGTLVAGVPADPGRNGSSMKPGGVYVFR